MATTTQAPSQDLETDPPKTRVAAVQMAGRTGDIPYNLAHVRELLDEAIRLRARVIAVPEFFTTPIVENPVLWQCALPAAGNPALDLLIDYATTHQVLIGGSYLERRGSDIYNCYTLVSPDGSVSRHDKDLPTMIENAYYRCGHDDGFHHTPLGKVGTAVCWETIRTQTVRRLAHRIDFLMTGSHWWSPPTNWKVGRSFMSKMASMNDQLMYAAPGTLASLLGVANMHAAHCGELRGSIPLLPCGLLSAPFDSQLMGETQIIDNQGHILARRHRDQGPGVISADLSLTPGIASLPCPDSYWIPRLPARFRAFWWHQNACAKTLYRQRHKSQQH